MAAAVAEVLGGALLVLDADGRRLDRVGALGPAGRGRDRRGGGRVAHRRPQRARAATVWSPRWSPAPRTWAPWSAAGRRTGDADQRILERAALVTALLLLFRRRRRRGRGAGPGRAARRTRRPRGTGRRTPCATRAAPPRRGPGRAARAAWSSPTRGRCASGPPSWADATRGRKPGWPPPATGQLVCLLPGADAGGAARVVARELGRVLGRPVTAGAAGPVAGAGGAAAATADAERALAALTALGRAGEGASTAELGFVGLLLGEGTRRRAATSRDTIGAGARLRPAARHRTGRRRWRRTSAAAAACPGRPRCCTST